MIVLYKRNARTFAELALGEMTPLNKAIPELASKSIAHGQEKGASRVTGKRRSSIWLRGPDTTPGQKP